MLARFALPVALALTFWPTFAHADDPPPWSPPIITPVPKGAPAPFAGVLLTPEAVAKVIAEAKDCPKRAQVEADKARAEALAQGDKALADAKANAKRDASILQAGIEQRDGQLKDLASRLDKAEQARSNTWLWAAGGVLGGALIVVLSVAAVGAAK